jgi:glycosyltransferase involved in cell wall biosynthesis
MAADLKYDAALPAVVMVHNRYQQSGGEDSVFEAEAQLLEEHGHEVRRVVFNNRDIAARPSVAESAVLAKRAIWSQESARQVARAVRESGAAVAHFHNTFPLTSPAAYSYCRREGVAVVQTLHNYRLICPNGLMFRQGRPCEDCVRLPLKVPGIIHRCYRTSAQQTAVVAAMLAVHSLRGTWANDVDTYVALTDFAKGKFVEGGLPAERIIVKPNFLLAEPLPEGSGSSQFLFVGRLATEKGLPVLLEAWGLSPFPLLTIVGDGPLADSVANVAGKLPNVVVPGRLQRQQVIAELRRSIALVFPSQCYETFGLAIIEAFACGVPVIASRLGAAAEIIADGQTGLLFKPGDAADLSLRLIWARKHPKEMRTMGAAARREYEAKYTRSLNYERLMAIYRRAREHRSYRL